MAPKGIWKNYKRLLENKSTQQIKEFVHRRWYKNVILLSENQAYDPIMLSKGQVNILGVAVGVVKTQA